MKSRFFTMAALVLTAGMVVGCTHVAPTSYEHSYPHQKRVDTKCWDGREYIRGSGYGGGYRGNPLLDDAVYFDVASTRLTAKATETLRDMASLVKDRAFCGSEIKIIGHTDDAGSFEANEKLAHKRAKAVKMALINMGVPAHLLMLQSAGEAAPIAYNDTNEGRANNRRVTFEVH